MQSLIDPLLLFLAIYASIPLAVSQWITTFLLVTIFFGTIQIFIERK